MYKYFITLLVSVGIASQPLAELVPWNGVDTIPNGYPTVHKYETPTQGQLDLIEALDSSSWMYYKDKQHFYLTWKGEDWGGINYPPQSGNDRKIFIATKHTSQVIQDLDMDLIDWDNGAVLWALFVSGHEYGHSIIKQSGYQPKDDQEEVLASTCATYFLLQLGCPPETIKQFFQDQADGYKDSEGRHDLMGHPDTYLEHLQNKENVDHVEEILQSKMPRT